MSRLYIVLIVSCMLWLSNALTAGPKKVRVRSVANSTIPLPPSKDPFYTAPVGYEKAAPGAVLRVRKSALAELTPHCSAAYNILFRTSDSNYKPTWAVTTLFVPETNSTVNATSGSSLLSYQTAYDSASVDMSPSFGLYSASIDPSIPDGLALGWYVNVPDYEGPLASFTAGVMSGHATIDSVRAALHPRFGLNGNSTKCALWGYSGGALAAEWAAELQVQYAPELHFAGMAVGGLTPNITNVLLATNNGIEASLIPNGIVGLASQDVATQEYLDSQLKTSGPYNKTDFLAVRTQNTTVDFYEFAFQNMFEYFESASAFLEAPVVQNLINRDGIMGYHGVPAMPIFAYKAIQDEISPIEDTDVLVQRYCAVGANILYHRNSIGGHAADATNEYENALKFIRAVLDGSYAELYKTFGCTIQNVTVGNDTSPE